MGVFGVIPHERETTPWMDDCKDAEGRTTQETKSRRYDYKEVIGRVESGTETERMSGTQSREWEYFD